MKAYEKASDVVVEVTPRPIGSVDTGIGAVSDLAYTINRFKVLMFLQRTNQEEVLNLVLDRDRLEEVAELLAINDSEDRKRKEVLKLLGIEERAEKEVYSDGVMDMKDVLGLQKDKKGTDKLNSIWVVEGPNHERKSVEEWIQILESKNAPLSAEEQKLVKDLKGAVEKVRDNYGGDRLKMVNLNYEVLGEISDGIDTLKAKNTSYISVQSKQNSGGRTAVSEQMIEEVQKTDGLLQVRDPGSGQKGMDLQMIVDQVRLESSSLVNIDELEKLTELELLQRFRNVNDLLWNVKALRGETLSFAEAKRLRTLLITMQTQYQEQLASKFAQDWKAGNKKNSWQEVKYQAMEKVINKKRWWFSGKVHFSDPDDSINLKELKLEVSKEADLAASKIAKNKYHAGAKSPYTDGGESSEYEKRQKKQWDKINNDLNQMLGGCKYNPFEDNDFWDELSEEGGIEKIVNKALVEGLPPSNKNDFEELMIRLKMQNEAGAGGARPRYGLDMGGQEDDPAVLTDLMRYLKLGEWGAAANVMLEYTTRVGMEENTNDLQFMYVRRMFMEKISVVCPDFADQFKKNQQIGYLPSMFNQKPEDFYSTQAKVFNKSMLDMFFGANALMSGNVIEVGGKKFAFSTKSVMAALRSERNILRIMRAKPNTIDSTLQNIMLEEMFGEGAHLGVEDVGGKDILHLVFADGSKHRMSDIQVNMSFAEIQTSGFKGWRNPSPAFDQLGRQRAMNLEEALNRNQWIMRNGLQFMWYSETWMDTLKSYQPAIMENTPKGLLVAASAICDYKASFENVAPPFLDLVQKIGDMLGPMERYKAADIMGKNVVDRLVNDALKRGVFGGNEENRNANRGLYEKVGKIFEKIYVRQTKASLNGSSVELNNRIRSREMIRHAFNNYQEMSDEVALIVRKRLVDIGVHENDIPSIASLRNSYDMWKSEASAGKTLGGKDGYMGQEYAAVWEELKELQFNEAMKIGNESFDAKDVWASLADTEFQVLVNTNAEVTGGFGQILTKDNFWKNVEIEAFVDRTHTKHGDDWEQFGGKYALAKIDALKLVYKIAALNGTAQDYVDLKEKLDLFMSPQEKRDLLLSLMDRQSIATREEWLVPYEVADIPDGHPKSSNEIKWVEYTDSTGKKFFARTADGTRAYHKKMFRGNYARQVLDKDWWRPHDFELLLDRWRADGFLTKHEAHHMAEKLLGTRRTVDFMVDGAARRLGIDPARAKGIKDFLAKSTTAIKLAAIKLFLFDDPKFAMVTLGQEVFGFTGKAFEHIFGFSVGGGAAKGHH